jgi:hypothetical protein
MFQSANTEIKTSQQLAQQLTISAPYFQPQDFERTGFQAGTLNTQLTLKDFASSLSSTLEPQLITTAQLFRRLSNLAICAIELNNKSTQQFCYLAEFVTAKNYQTAESDNPNVNAITELNLNDFPLTAKAKGKLVNQSAQSNTNANNNANASASAKVDLYNNKQQKVYSLKLSFVAIKWIDFQQKYASYRHNNQPPYTQTDKQANSQTSNQLTAEQIPLPTLTDVIHTPPAHAATVYGPIDPIHCAGHIDGFNPLPIDVLVSKSTELALQWLAIQYPDSHHLMSIKKYQLTTSELAFSHDELSISCCQLDNENNTTELTVSVLIYVRSQAISEMELTFVRT